MRGVVDESGAHTGTGINSAVPRGSCSAHRHPGRESPRPRPDPATRSHRPGTPLPDRLPRGHRIRRPGCAHPPAGRAVQHRARAVGQRRVGRDVLKVDPRSPRQQRPPPGRSSSCGPRRPAPPRSWRRPPPNGSARPGTGRRWSAWTRPTPARSRPAPISSSSPARSATATPPTTAPASGTRSPVNRRPGWTECGSRCSPWATRRTTTSVGTGVDWTPGSASWAGCG